MPGLPATCVYLVEREREVAIAVVPDGVYGGTETAVDPAPIGYLTQADLDALKTALIWRDLPRPVLDGWN